MNDFFIYSVQSLLMIFLYKNPYYSNVHPHPHHQVPNRLLKFNHQNRTIIINDFLLYIFFLFRNDQTIIRSRSEPPIQNGNKQKNIYSFVFSRFQGVINGVEGRNENLLRWAFNLTRDCDLIETKLKYLRPGKIQSIFDRIRSLCRSKNCFQNFLISKPSSTYFISSISVYSKTFRNSYVHTLN